MKVERVPACRVFGEVIDPAHDELVFSKTELATLAKACEIVEGARDRLRDLMGVTEFECSTYYTLAAGDVVDWGGRIWYGWPE